MKKYGKYEKLPDGTRAKQPAVKRMLLQTYFTSLLCLVLCVTMFLGTSYAWFTSEVTNEGNEIYIGTLDVGLFNKNGDNWLDLSEDDHKLFDSNIRWEPGYTALETVKIVNEGDLAFRYVLNFTDGAAKDKENNNVDLESIAEHFDIWVYDHQANENSAPDPDSYADIVAENSGWKKVGTLTQVLNGEDVLKGTMEGVRDDDTETEVNEGTTDGVGTQHTYTIALHMSEEATNTVDESGNNSLMGKRISLNVKLTAYQQTYEEDAFGATYDLEAFVNTLAQVNNLEDRTIKYMLGINGEKDQDMTLDVAYQFLPNETLNEAQSAPYRYYIADFVVKADKDVPANSMALAGYYKAWCDLLAESNWVALTSPDDITAGTEIRLVQAMGNGGISVNYEALCEYGNDGTGFLCGAADISENDVNKGTTLTVELRLYETYSEEECLEKFGYKSKNEETGRYITVGSYQYTFQ